MGTGIDLKKYENFCAAFENMGDIFQYSEPYDNVVLTGMVMLYKICFEQSWKLMKGVLAAYGYEESAAGSPKMILKTAYKAGMIKDEALWLAALNAQNNVSHAYNRAIALEIVRSSKREFYEMFRQLKEEIERWLEIQQL